MQSRLLSNIQQKLIGSMASLEAYSQRLPILMDRKMQAEHHRLQLMEEKLKALDPTLLLSRGYSITLHNGRAVKDASTLSPGDELETRLSQGTIHSVVK